MKVKIYQPAKSAMQSGKSKLKWLVKKIEETNPRSIEDLMGWVAVENTDSQLHFSFNSKEEAIEFAKKKNFDFEIEEPKKAILQKKSYANNFL